MLEKFYTKLGKWWPVLRRCETTGKTSPPVTGMRENTPKALADFAKVMSRQNVGPACWLLSVIYDEIQEE